MGATAYRQRKPIWTCPFVGEGAELWRRAYREAQAAAGGTMFSDLPIRRTPARVVARTKRAGGVRAAAAGSDTISPRRRA